MKQQKFENVFDALYDGKEALEMKRRAECAARRAITAAPICAHFADFAPP
jgi:hypothetical protein